RSGPDLRRIAWLARLVVRRRVALAHLLHGHVDRERHAALHAERSLLGDAPAPFLAAPGHLRHQALRAWTMVSAPAVVSNSTTLYLRPSLRWRKQEASIAKGRVFVRNTTPMSPGCQSSALRKRFRTT